MQGQPREYYYNGFKVQLTPGQQKLEREIDELDKFLTDSKKTIQWLLSNRYGVANAQNYSDRIALKKVVLNIAFPIFEFKKTTNIDRVKLLVTTINCESYNKQEVEDASVEVRYWRKQQQVMSKEQNKIFSKQSSSSSESSAKLSKKRLLKDLYKNWGKLEEEQLNEFCKQQNMNNMGLIGVQPMDQDKFKEYVRQTIQHKEDESSLNFIPNPMTSETNKNEIITSNKVQKTDETPEVEVDQHGKVIERDEQGNIIEQ